LPAQGQRDLSPDGVEADPGKAIGIVDLQHTRWRRIGGIVAEGRVEAAKTRAIVRCAEIAKREPTGVEIGIRQRGARQATGGKPANQEQTAAGLVLSCLTCRMRPSR
jgi:hypothetical protein